MKKINLKNLKLIKYFEQEVSNFMYHWDYLRVLNSPFKGLRLKWYWGKIQHGVPYFLPRKWVKMTKEDCEECLKRDQKSMLRQYVVDRTWEYYKNTKKAVPIKYFGFEATTLGWKTKWSEYRYEWAPCYSLVIFGKQLFVTVLPNIGDDCLKWGVYWEAWLNYSHCTDKTKSKQKRLEELIEKHSCTWITTSKDTKQVSTDYYPFIIKEKYYEKIKKK